MAITTVAGLSTGLLPTVSVNKTGSTMQAGSMYSLYYVGPVPAALSAPAPGLTGAALDNTSGGLPFTNPASGETRLASWEGQASTQGLMILYDRLWHNSGVVVTTTTSQSLGAVVAYGARDANGSTNGVGVMAAIEVSSATSSSNTAMTISYTNSAGTAGRTGTLESMVAFPSSAPVGTFVPFALQAGDLGVRSIESITLSTSLTAGAVHLVLWRPIAALAIPASADPARLVAGVGNLAPKIYDSSNLHLVWHPASAGATTFGGHEFQFAQG